MIDSAATEPRAAERLTNKAAVTADARPGRQAVTAASKPDVAGQANTADAKAAVTAADSSGRAAKISLRDVSLSYANNGAQLPVLHKLSFEVYAGEFVSLIGGSGCGKSTTLSLISGLNQPDLGAVHIDGLPVTGPGKDRSVVFQHYALFPWMRAQRNVEFGIRQVSDAGKREVTAKAKYYLKRVGLEGKEFLYPHQLSGGMQQRVAIARALAMETDILLMDEPFGAVDAKTRAVLQDLLLELLEEQHRKRTVVFVTHDIDEAILLSDRILFINNQHLERQIELPFAHPKTRSDIVHSPVYRELRKEVFDLFYEDEGEYFATGI